MKIHTRSIISPDSLRNYVGPFVLPKIGPLILIENNINASQKLIGMYVGLAVLFSVCRRTGHGSSCVDDPNSAKYG